MVVKMEHFLKICFLGKFTESSQCPELDAIINTVMSLDHYIEVENEVLLNTY